MTPLNDIQLKFERTWGCVTPTDWAPEGAAAGPITPDRMC